MAIEDYLDGEVVKYSSHLFVPVGSRVTCCPAPTDTDEDYLIYDPTNATNEQLKDNGFEIEGLPNFYTGNDNGEFRSFRKGNCNVITTPDHKFYRLFLTATELAKRFNLLEKKDRIALFQAVLYQVEHEDLETK